MKKRAYAGLWDKVIDGPHKHTCPHNNHVYECQHKYCEVSERTSKAICPAHWEELYVLGGTYRSLFKKPSERGSVRAGYQVCQ